MTPLDLEPGLARLGYPSFRPGDVALLRPRTLVELQQAYGIGPAKAGRYGKRILAAVAGALR
jgi:hypothetical protein